MPLGIFPEHIIQQYDLNGKVHLEIRCLAHGLPQSRKLANDYLKAKLVPAGYYEVPHTLGLWKYISCPVSFTLVVDDFGVKCVGKQNIQHLINALKKDFTISEDWTDRLFCGITLKWDYAYYENQTLDFSMLGYIKKVLQRYKHEMPKRPQRSPYPVAPIKYGKGAQDPIPEGLCNAL